MVTGEILKDIIKDDKNSRAKHEMQQGVKYYDGYNDILNVDFRKYFVRSAEYTDYNKSNEHIVNNFQKKLVDQKKDYIASKPVTLKCDDEVYTNKIKDLLGTEFDDTLLDIIKNAANKGYGTLHPFIDEMGEFDFVITPSEQLIYIYDTAYEKKLLNVVRYFNMKLVVDGKERNTTRAEVWDFKKVTYYQEDNNSEFRIITPGEMDDITVNPKYHWYNVNTVTEASTGGSWGKVPFIKFKNNSEQRSDLMVIKSYIDAIDVVSSGFVNDLRDIQLAVWVLKGYEGEDLGEFMTNLMTFKAIKLDAEGNSSAEPKTLDIPKEARETLLNWLEKKLYDVGQGVNEAALTGSSLTTTAIKAAYSGLNSKSNAIIIKATKSLTDFMYFVTEFINERDNTSYNYEDIKFVFNTSMISNEIETLTILKDLGVRISQKTMLAQVPFINDIEAEQKLIEEEDEKALADMGGALGFGDE